ncbi:MAG TPA: pilus assembly protein TadG-related protein [Acidimicrobiales bacterium]|nr:pilus assembly protein TadG-related protein [Acidimicrobiales bacterium]
MSRRRCRGEDGIFTLFTALIVAAFLILAGLAVDGGYVLAARRRAIDEANGAARAGAEALAPSAYRTSGDLVLDPDAAAAAAQGFLAATGHSGTVTVDGNEVLVSLNFDQPMSLLRIIGIESVNVQGRGQARSVRGIDTGETAP